MKHKSPHKRHRKADLGVGYVVNVPVAVPDDSDGESSCDEEEDGLAFPENYFEKPLEYFRLYQPKRNDEGKIISTKRGAVSNRFFKTNPAVAVPQKTQGLINIFYDTAFGESPEESHELIPEKLSMVIGLNRMRSLSTRNNNALKNSVVGPIKEPFTVEQIGFFWEGVWEERDPESTSGWKTVNYDRVHRFYKILKGKNHVLAENFLKSIEKSKSHLVPYRDIREAIKTSKKTHMCVLKMRGNNPQRELYLALSDNDVISWRGDKIGAFSFYDSMIEKHTVTYQQPLEIGTVGYTIPKIDPASHQNNPMIVLSVFLDLWVRHATAQFVKNGVYYPEPSMIIRILPTKDCLEESFVDQKDRHYQAPKESTILIGNVLSKRDLDPESSMCFDAAGAFVMQMPARMQRDFEATKIRKA